MPPARKLKASQEALAKESSAAHDTQQWAVLSAGREDHLLYPMSSQEVKTYDKFWDKYRGQPGQGDKKARTGPSPQELVDQARACLHIRERLC